MTPTGSKLWNIASPASRKTQPRGFPTISLKAARESREAIKQLLASGTNPGQRKKQVAVEKAHTAAMTFDLIAAELVEKKRRAAKDGRTLTKGGLLRAISTYEGAPETQIELELLGPTFVRPGELRAAEWEEFDLEAATWSIPASKMKMRRAA